MITTTYPPTMTVEEAGELLGLSRSAAYRAAAKGELPTLRFGRRLFVPTIRLLNMLGLDNGDFEIHHDDGS
ncbi:MAG: helix-turn-helix domain-containing protein [Actinobacteria bacterium]|nr:helix-turn-helix domain-containing protein [Actinomycetota bacterium]